MKTATLELDQREIAEAVKLYIEKDGWKVQGQVHVTIRRGYSDPREGDTPDTISMSAQVTR